MKRLTNEYPNYLFVSPIHTFPFLYESVNYQKGLDMCLWLLEKCDEIWVFGDYQSSVGCMSEIAYCQNYFIPYKIIECDCPWQFIEFNPKTDVVYKDFTLITQKCDKCLECGMVDYDESHLSCEQKHIRQLYEKCKLELQVYGE